ncbi:MAG: twin-arginine translocation signal domain-containing protein [Burkholderiales bacterium]|nr:twin-arginine translocation signal domain-containing protein [Burkholderiales bacterium]
MNSKMNRRKFLAAVGVGGAAAAAAVTQVGGERERSAEAGQKVRDGRGYQVTEHVRRYYETTKV